jgi:hypothetical protein
MIEFFMGSKNNQNNKQLLYKYAGFSAQLLVSLGLAVLAGQWLDKKLSLYFPIAIWAFPLAVLFIILYKVVKDTSPKK